MNVVTNTPLSYSSVAGTGVEVSISGPVMVASNNSGYGVPNLTSQPTSLFGKARDSGITVNVQTPNGVITFKSAVSSSGFSFTVPEVIIVKPVNSSGDLAKGFNLRAQLSDGSPLPSWLSFNENTNTFIANQIPENVDTVKIDIQTVVGNKVVGSTTIEINPK